MRLNIEDRFFSEPNCRLLADDLNLEFTDLIGRFVLLWHDSQALGKAVLTGRLIMKIMRIPEEMGEDLINGMIDYNFIRGYEKKECSFSSQYIISGNRKQIENAKKSIRKSQKASMARWEKGGSKSLEIIDRNAPSMELSRSSSNAITITNTNTNTNTTKDIKRERQNALSSSLQKIWNENCGSLPKVSKISSSRSKHINIRMKEDPDPEYWIQTVKRLSESDFCRGNNDRGWKANFDFLLRPDTHIKVNEGIYDNQKRINNDSQRKQKDEILDGIF